MKRTHTYQHIMTIIVAILFIWGCETDITVDLPTPEEKLIVEGKIEKDEPAMVFLSRNRGYFEPVEIAEVSDSLVMSDYISMLEESMGLIYDSSLLITVSKGALTDTLTAGFTMTKFPYFGYFGNKITGNPGSTYSLEIHYKNNTYWSKTSIPPPVAIDSIWFTYKQDNDTLGFLHFLFEDPDNYRNFYALELKTVGEHYGYFSPYYGSHVFDDEGLNGDTIRYTPLTKAYDSNDFFQQEFENDTAWNEAVYHKFGDEVNIKLSSIDKPLFMFWMSFYKHLGTAGNPFTNPATLKSNISGGNADGYWGGYGSSITNITIDSTLVRDTLTE